MGGIVAFLLIAAVVVVAAGAVGAYALASRSKKDFADANQVIPGRPTRAPASWAGSHDPEAVLHRRLRDAMAALRANQRFDDDGALLDVRVELEAQALVLDDELVSVAALPQAHRHDPLARVTEAGATIIAHEVARKRMSEEQYIEVVDRRIPPLPEGALPRITFTSGLTLHCGRETVKVSFRPLPLRAMTMPSKGCTRTRVSL